MSNINVPAPTVDPLAYLPTRSADNEMMLPYWSLTDDIISGVDAMRAAGTKHMPRFPAESTEDYDFRLKYTKMTNIYRDVIEGLSQKPFEEEASLIESEGNKIPEALLQFVEDVDGTGNNLTGFASSQFFNAINSAITWIFVDFSKPLIAVRTKLDEVAAGVRPFWTYIAGRNVLEVRSKTIGRKEMFTYIRTIEPGSPNRYREMRNETGNLATWTLFREENDSGRKRYVIEEEGTFTIGEIPMVPFATGRRDGRRQFYYPMMQDAADLQKNLYWNESGLEYAKILTAYPMLAGNGVTPERGPDGKPVPIMAGPGKTVYAPPGKDGNSGGSWTFIEPSATSLTFLASDIKDTQQQLRELGRQPLTAQSGQLTVITTAVAASKSRSAVASWALSLKNALENAFVLTCKWLKIPPNVYDPQVFVFTDFDDFSDSTADVDALNSARDRGDISRDALIEEYKRRKILRPEYDADEDMKKILAESPGDSEDIDPVTGKIVEPKIQLVR